jgi:hypothetical protein
VARLLPIGYEWLMKAHRYVNDTPYPSFAVLLENSADLIRLHEVAYVCIDLSAVLLSFSRIFW